MSGAVWLPRRRGFAAVLTAALVAATVVCGGGAVAAGGAGNQGAAGGAGNQGAAGGAGNQGTAGGAGQGDVPLRVATYNIHTGIGSDGQLDLERTAAVIRASRAEVVGLEEVDVHWAARSDWRDQTAELARMLKMHAFFAPIYSLDPLSPGEPRREYGVAVLSKHRIVSAQNHDLTRLSTQDPNPTPAPAPGFAEAVVDVRGERVHVYVTHLDYRADPSVREAQVADTRRILADDGTDAHQVLLGDFNAEPDAPELAPLWSDLTDGWAAANGTAPGLTYPADVPVKRIDYVTVSEGIGVRRAEVPATLASDHRPVIADLSVRRGHPRP